jgi:hypothetical protein
MTYQMLRWAYRGVLLFTHLPLKCAKNAGVVHSQLTLTIIKYYPIHPHRPYLLIYNYKVYNDI